MQWKLKSGELIDVLEMSDEHFNNALKWAEKNDFKCNIRLLEQKKIREENKFLNKKRKCPFCKDEMKMGKVNGGWIHHYHYFCKCGARSNRVDRF